MSKLPGGITARNTVIFLSLLLFFVAVPHTLEDFTLGEPAKHAVPIFLLASVVAGLFALQAMGMFFIGSGKRAGYYIHIGLGVLWALAAGSAQLPVILTAPVYRSGFASLFYVFGIIVVGILLFFTSLLGLKGHSR